MGIRRWKRVLSCLEAFRSSQEYGKGIDSIRDVGIYCGLHIWSGPEDTLLYNYLNILTGKSLPSGSYGISPPFAPRLYLIISKKSVNAPSAHSLILKLSLCLVI